jgi:hypothetical protein
LRYFDGLSDLQFLSKKDLEKLAELKVINASNDPKGQEVADYIKSQAQTRFKEMKYGKIKRQKCVVSKSKTAKSSSSGM